MRRWQRTVPKISLFHNKCYVAAACEIRRSISSTEICKGLILACQSSSLTLGMCFSNQSLELFVRLWLVEAFRAALMRFRPVHEMILILKFVWVWFMLLLDHRLRLPPERVAHGDNESC